MSAKSKTKRRSLFDKFRKSHSDLSEWSKNDDKLMVAIEADQADKVNSILTKKSINPTKLDPQGHTALHRAAAQGKLSVVEVLIKHKADLNSKDVQGRTALSCACRHGRPDIAERLLQAENNTDSRDHKDQRALHHSAIGGSLDCTRLLLLYNASADAEDKEKKTPLFYAAQMGYPSICQLLVQHGALVNHRDCEKKTALMLASEFGHVEVADLLVKKGTNVLLTDDIGNNAGRYAVNGGYLDIKHIIDNAPMVTSWTIPQNQPNNFVITNGDHVDRVEPINGDIRLPQDIAPFEDLDSSKNRVYKIDDMDDLDPPAEYQQIQGSRVAVGYNEDSDDGCNLVPMEEMEKVDEERVQLVQTVRIGADTERQDIVPGTVDEIQEDRADRMQASIQHVIKVQPPQVPAEEPKQTEKSPEQMKEAYKELEEEHELLRDDLKKMALENKALRERVRELEELLRKYMAMQGFETTTPKIEETTPEVEQEIFTESSETLVPVPVSEEELTSMKEQLADEKEKNKELETELKQLQQQLNDVDSKPEAERMGVGGGDKWGDSDEELFDTPQRDSRSEELKQLAVLKSQVLQLTQENEQLKLEQTEQLKQVEIFKVEKLEQLKLEKLEKVPETATLSPTHKAESQSSLKDLQDLGQLEVFQQAHEVEVNKLTAQLEEAQNTIQELKDKLTSVESEKAAAEDVTNKLEERFQELVDSRNYMEQELEHLHHYIENMRGKSATPIDPKLSELMEGKYNMEEELERLQSCIEALRSRGTTPIDWNAWSAELYAELEKLRNDNNKLNEDLEEIHEEHDELQLEKERVDEELLQIKEQLHNMSDIVLLNENLQKQNSKMKGDYNREMQQQVQRLEELAAINANLQKENNKSSGDLRQDLKDKNKQIDNLSSANEQLMSDLETLREQAKQAESNLQEAESKVKETESQIKEAERKAKEAEFKIKEAESKAKDAEFKIKEAESKAKETESKLEKMESKAQKAEPIHESNQIVQEDIEPTEVRGVTLEKFVQITHTETKIKPLEMSEEEEKTSDFESIQDQNRTLIDSIDELTMENRILTTEIKQLKKEVEIYEKFNVSDFEKIVTEHDRLSKENEKLLKDLERKTKTDYEVTIKQANTTEAKLEPEVDMSVDSGYKRGFEELQYENGKLRDEIARLKEMVVSQSDEYVKEQKDVEDQLADLSTERTKLQQRCSELENQILEKSPTQKDVDSTIFKELQDKVENLESELIQVQIEKDKVETELKENVQKQESIRSETIEPVSASLQQAALTPINLVDINVEEKNEVDKHKFDELSSANEILEKENSDLNTQLLMMQQSVSMIDQEKRSIDDNNASLRKELDEINNKIRNKEEELDKEIKKLHEVISGLDEERNALREGNAYLNEEISKLHDKLKEAEDKGVKDEVDATPAGLLSLQMETIQSPTKQDPTESFDENLARETQEILMEQNTKLSEQLLDYDNLASENLSLKQQIQNITEQSDEEKHSLLQENATLQEELDEALEASRDVQALVDENRLLQEELDRLKDSVNEGDVYKKDCEIYKEQLEDVQGIASKAADDNKQLNRQIKNLHGSLMELDQLRRENEEMTQQLSAANIIIEENEKLQAREEELVKINAELQTRLEKLETDMNNVNEALQVETLKREQSDTLRAETQILVSASPETMAVNSTEANTLKADNEQLEGKVRGLEAQIDQFEQNRTDSEALRSEIQILNDERAKWSLTTQELKEQISRLNKENEELKDTNELETLRADNVKLSEAVFSLQEQLSNLQKETENQTSSNENQLQIENETLQKSVQDLETKLSGDINEKVELENSVLEHQREIAVLQKEVEMLEQEVVQLETVKLVREDTDKEIESLKKDNDVLREQCSKFSLNEKEKLLAENEELIAEIEELHKQLREMQSQKEGTLLEESKESKLDNERLLNEYLRMQEDVMKLRKENQALSNDLSESHNALQNQREEAELSVQQLMEEQEMLLQKLKSMETESNVQSSQKNNNSPFLTDLDALREECASLRSENSQIKGALEAQRNEQMANIADSYIASLRGENNMLHEKVHELEDSLSQHGSRVGSTATTPRRLSVDLLDGSSAEKEIKDLHRRLRQVQQELVETDTKHRETINTYRTHLLAAVQGRMDPEVKQALSHIVKLRHTESVS